MSGHWKPRKVVTKIPLKKPDESIRGILGLAAGSTEHEQAVRTLTEVEIDRLTIVQHVCMVCNTLFPTEEALTDHATKNHPSDLYLAPQATAAEITIDSNNVTQSEIKPEYQTLQVIQQSYQSPLCTLCNLMVTEEGGLKAHLQRAHSEYTVL